MPWKKLHWPSIGTLALIAGGVLRIIAAAFNWPVAIVVLSQVVLLMAVAWIVMYDFFPIFLPPFDYVRTNYKRRVSFFFALLGFFAAMQTVSVLLPSGPMKDATTTLSFVSFVSSIVWGIGAYVVTSFTPLLRYVTRKPKDLEKISFADVVTSMAVILTPTIALSYFFTPPGLVTNGITPYQVFLTSLLTNILMGAYLYLFIIRPKVFTLRQLGVRKVDREDVSKALVLFIFISVLVFVANSILRRLGVPLQQYSFIGREGASFALVAVVVLTPFIEELYFRGFLFKGLLYHNAPWVAYGVSSLLFALLHPPLVVMIDVFIIGLLLAYTAKQTKSIWPGVLIHALNNAIVFGYLLYQA